ncbi:MAG: hypothetical protein U9R32_11690 [Bacteroidota bacterium]|nr:hypothetical protein [Bacteroidota bacterium]
MHLLEPHYNWRDYYTAEEDEESPFYGRIYSEFEFHNAIYNHVIHPQWDEFGSNTLYIKILFADYTQGFCIIEMIGEWNDLLYNDIMHLKRNVIEHLIYKGINKFILIGENILTFHNDGDDYYQEWFEEIEDGWIVGINFQNNVINELSHANIDYYITIGGQFDEMNWRTLRPEQLFTKIETIITKRLEE